MSKKEIAVQTAQENNNQVETKDVAKSTEVTQEKTITESIEELKNKLEAQLKVVERKNELAGNRERFISTKKELERVKNYLRKEMVFESNYVSVIFKAPTANDNYSRELFSITNKSLLNKFIEVLNLEIDNKVKEIEAEIIQ